MAASEPENRAGFLWRSVERGKYFDSNWDLDGRIAGIAEKDQIAIRQFHDTLFYSGFRAELYARFFLFRDRRDCLRIGNGYNLLDFHALALVRAAIPPYCISGSGHILRRVLFHSYAD